MKGLRFFRRTSPGSLHLLSYHDPRSITWSRLLSMHRTGQGCRRWGVYASGRLFGPKTVILNAAGLTLFYQSQTKLFWKRASA